MIVVHDHLAAQAVQLDSHLAEYVPNDILSTAEGISYDLDVNELMVSPPWHVINLYSQHQGMAQLQGCIDHCCKSLAEPHQGLT